MSSFLGPNPPALRLAKIAALFLSSSLSGASLGMSAFVVPRLLESPVPLMLRQWLHAYSAGFTYFPPITIVAGAAYFYLAAAASPSTSLVGRAYLAAGLLTVGIIPYTLAFMMPTNRKLEARAKAASLQGAEVVAETEEAAWAQGEGSRYLVDHWATLNLVRTAMLAAGALTGLAAAL